jgi:hypothetical protein
MGVHVADADRLWFVDEYPEDPATSRSLTDRSLLLWRQAVGQKPLKLPSVMVENAKRRITSSSDRTSSLEQPFQQSVEVRFGDQARAELDELS